MSQNQSNRNSNEISFLTHVLKSLKIRDLLSVIFCFTLGQGTYIFLSSLLGIIIEKIFTNGAYAPLWILLFPCVWGVSILFTSLGKIQSSVLTQNVRKNSKKILFRHIIYLPNSVYQQSDPGAVEHLVQEISLCTRYVFSESFIFFIKVFVILIVSFAVISNESILLAILFLVWTAIYIPVSYVSSKFSVKFIADSLTQAAAVSANTVDVLNNHELIPSFGTAELEIQRFNQLLEKERLSFVKAQYRIDLTDFFHKLLLLLLPLGVALYLALFSQISLLQVSEMATLFSFTILLTNQIGDIGKGILGFFEVKERIKTALEKLTIHQETSNPKNKSVILPLKSSDVEFENVCFAYENKQIIKELNLTIHDKEKIGIIGYSGAGKTTLIKLLRGYILPNKGTIRIGGKNINDLGVEYLAKNIAEVSQTIPILHRTLRENVTYGSEDTSDEKVWEILERAQIAKFVRSLPNQLDTIVGVNGTKLSGGEKARIAIARALLRQSNIIILDEATASLDSESEYLLQQALEQLISETTVIAIAHRLSTLRKTDRIIILDDGRVIAEGSHEELKNNELYQQFLQKQSWLL